MDTTASVFSTLAGRLFSALAVCSLLYAWGNGNFAALAKVRIVIADGATDTRISEQLPPVGGQQGAALAAIPTATEESIPTDFSPLATDLSDRERNADQRRRHYLKQYAPLARAEMQKYRIPASITLAQGLLESDAGASPLARNNNNHFGMKCFSKRCGRGHCTNATDDTHKDFFKKYKSAWASYRDHSQLLTTGRYKNIRGDYRAWAEGLQRHGYATSKTYAADLIRIIEIYQLQRLDR